jgi:5-deoxy-glucuronate isomerase
MSELVVHSTPPGEDGGLVAVTPESAGWTYVGFEVLRLRPGQERSWQDPARELCLVVLSGRLSVEAGEVRVAELGQRGSVFGGLPSAIYVPAGVRCTAKALSVGAEIALCWAPGGQDPSLVPYAIEDVEVQSRGEGIAQRTVHPILMEDRPAQSLLVVEVLTPAGHWSSFPPHKHDLDDPPHQTLLEETYYHRLRPSRGFALQRVYDDERSLDETIAIADGDVVLVPRGYHVVAAMPGYDLYYLNVMAGPRREWIFQDDPDHAWLRA